MSDERDDVTPGSKDPGAPDATTPAEGSGPAGGEDTVTPAVEAAAEGAAGDEAAGHEESAEPVVARPTGKRRAAASGSTRPDRSRPAAEGSKRAAGRATTRRSVAEAPERRGPVSRVTRFFREVVAELRKVIWPTRKELVTYTSVVLVFVTFMVALVSGLDILFAKGVLALFG